MTMSYNVNLVVGVVCMSGKGSRHAKSEGYRFEVCGCVGKED
jgi:hypothetical protein